MEYLRIRGKCGFVGVKPDGVGGTSKRHEVERGIIIVVFGTDENRRRPAKCCLRGLWTRWWRLKLEIRSGVINQPVWDARSEPKCSGLGGNL